MAATDPSRTCEFNSGSLLLRLERSIPGEVAEISPVVDEVMGIVGQMGCAAGKEFEIETALREALVNAVRYGCGQDPGKQVQVVVECDETRGMLIVVRDPGPGFDPASIPSPIEGQRIYETHGRGIYLINLLMDDVRYAHGGTEIIMRKR